MKLRDELPYELVGELHDGTVLLFRTIRPEDRDRVRDGFERLSPESRYRRFFRSIDRLTDEQLDYLTNVDGENHVAWVALLRDEPGQPGVGVARWVRVADDPETAEAAVTVVDDYQGRGIGSVLLRLATASAVARGVKRFRAWTRGDNRAVLDLLERFGVARGRWESGVMEVTVDLPEDTGAAREAPAPLVLRAIATGRLLGEAHDGEGGRIRFLGTPEDRGRDQEDRGRDRGAG